MELALALAMDMVGGRTTRSQVEGMLESGLTGRGCQPRVSTALIRELRLRRQAELRDSYTELFG